MTVRKNILHFLTSLVGIAALTAQFSKSMKMHHFVSGSAVMIAGWLMVTFFHDVSPQQYPQQHRGVPAHSASHEPLKVGGLTHSGYPEDFAKVAATRMP